MWTKKTEKELEEERSKSKRSMKGPIYVFILVFIFTTIGTKFSIFFIWNPGKIGEIISWAELIEVYTPFNLIFSLLISVFYYLRQRKSGRLLRISDDKDIFVCEDCRKIQNKNNENRCSCGGKLINVKFFKWVNEVNDKTV